jgi:hypothetical protein
MKRQRAAVLRSVLFARNAQSRAQAARGEEMLRQLEAWKRDGRLRVPDMQPPEPRRRENA